MHRNLMVIGIVGLFLMLSACSTQTEMPVAKSMPVPAEGVVSDNSAESVVIEETESKGALKQFEMIAKQFEFMPEAIEVDQGDRVKISLTSLDVAHGFAINEYGINERIVPGQPTVVEFTADKKGTFTFYCSVMCGSGHRNMRGTLIVK